MPHSPITPIVRPTLKIGGRKGKGVSCVEESLATVFLVILDAKGAAESVWPDIMATSERGRKNRFATPPFEVPYCELAVQSQSGFQVFPELRRS